MNKYIFLLLCLFFMLSTKAALAVNYTYKVYNPKTNKSYNAVFGTVSFIDNYYIWGFYTKDGTPLCILHKNNTNVKNGLVGGICTDANAFMRFANGENIDLSKYNMAWSELNQGTIYREMEDIRQERAAIGKYEYQAGIKY